MLLNSKVQIFLYYSNMNSLCITQWISLLAGLKKISQLSWCSEDNKSMDKHEIVNTNEYVGMDCEVIWSAKNLPTPIAIKPTEFIVENILSLSTLLLKITQFSFFRDASLFIWFLLLNLQNLNFKYFYTRNVIHSNTQLKKGQFSSEFIPEFFSCLSWNKASLKAPLR